MRFFITWKFNHNGMVFSENVSMLELLDRLIDNAITITEIYNVDDDGNVDNTNVVDDYIIKMWLKRLSQESLFLMN